MATAGRQVTVTAGHLTIGLNQLTTARSAATSSGLTSRSLGATGQSLSCPYTWGQLSRLLRGYVFVLFMIVRSEVPTEGYFTLYGACLRPFTDPPSDTTTSICPPPMHSALSGSIVHEGATSTIKRAAVMFVIYTESGDAGQRYYALFDPNSRESIEDEKNG